MFWGSTAPDIMAFAKHAGGSFLLEHLPNIGGREIGTGNIRNLLQMLHDKLTQSVLVPGAVKQLITVKLTGNTDGSAGCFRLLQLHRTAKQELLLFRHGGKPLFQPLVFGFGQFQSVQCIHQLNKCLFFCHIKSSPFRSAPGLHGETEWADRPVCGLVRIL